MTKEEFKRRWELDDRGDGITNEEVANCAEQWGLCKRPRTMHMQYVLKIVLLAAGVER